MKKRLLTLLLALALAVSLALPAAAAQTPVEVSSALELAQAMAEPVSARGRFRSRAAAAEPTRVVAFAPALADGYGADRVLLLAAWQEYVLEFSDATAAQRALARLRSDPDVTDCFLDEAVTADDTLAGLWDETASRSWGGHEMGLTTLRHQADVLLPAGRRATVAVIDTGAEVSHPLLAGRVSARSYDFADNTADVTDVNGHGTATAGLVADLTPDEVDVMVLRVYGDDNLSKPSRVLTALEYALENGATVVNMSIGWPNAIEKGYSILNSVLAQAYAAGVVVVAAAGNLSQSNPTANADDVYPANQAQVLTVSAVDRSRTFDDTYSASGASVDLCAPGTGVAVAAHCRQRGRQAGQGEGGGRVADGDLGAVTGGHLGQHTLGHVAHGQHRGELAEAGGTLSTGGLGGRGANQAGQGEDVGLVLGGEHVNGEHALRVANHRLRLRAEREVEVGTILSQQDAGHGGEGLARGGGQQVERAGADAGQLGQHRGQQLLGAGLKPLEGVADRRILGRLGEGGTPRGGLAGELEDVGVMNLVHVSPWATSACCRVGQGPGGWWFWTGGPRARPRWWSGWRSGQ